MTEQKEHLVTQVGVEDVDQEEGVSANWIAVGGILFGVLAWFILGIPFGTVAIVSGFKAVRKGSNWGYVAVALGVLDILGVIVGMAVSL